MFYEVLTGRNVMDLKWRPSELTEAQAESLRAAAYLSVISRSASGSRKGPKSE